MVLENKTFNIAMKQKLGLVKRDPIGGSFWQKHTFLQQTMTLLQGPKYPVANPNLSIHTCQSAVLILPTQFKVAQWKKCLCIWSQYTANLNFPIK